ncbi:MAG: adenylyltransferase/cytidyltransferase family protein [Eudoraea sp.]|nr:adenylyltransferase/cytidyltransferase family protein [Eudoraea sp.]
MISPEHLTSFSLAFPLWEISDEHNDQIRIHTPDTRQKDEVPKIIAFFYERLDNKGFSLKVIEEPGLTICLYDEKTPKYNRMYTSGCFDIFHYGHLNILRRSKKMCNHLIVGVSTDELIEKEKGKRPVIPYDERARVLESISYVDQVIPQVDKNKQQIVDDYAIDAISVGDDWKGRYPAVTCAMEYFPYTKSVSSTILKDALKLTMKDKD